MQNSAEYVTLKGIIVFFCIYAAACVVCHCFQPNQVGIIFINFSPKDLIEEKVKQARYVVNVNYYSDVQENNRNTPYAVLKLVRVINILVQYILCCMLGIYSSLKHIYYFFLLST